MGLAFAFAQDLRIFTIWRAEVAHFKAQHLPYRKTGTEWEILGELAQRLRHRDEAKDAFQRALDQKFSAKAWLKLLEIYVEEGDVQRSLNAAIRLSVYQHRWYMEQSVRDAHFRSDRGRYRADSLLQPGSTRLRWPRSCSS